MKISSNGIQLNVIDTGSGDLALVFQHHWGGSSLTWREVTLRLREGFRCIAIDARGAEESDAPTTGYSTGPISASSREQLIVDGLRLSPEATAGWIDIGPREDFSKHAATVNVPIVTVAGELDHVDPRYVVEVQIVPHNPNAQVNLLRNKGPLLPVEFPQEVATLITFMADTRIRDELRIPQGQASVPQR